MAYHRHFPRSSIPLSETLEAWTLVLSIIAAAWLVGSGLIPELVEHTSNFGLIGSFIEGFFFTSILTTIPAIVALIESARYVSPWELALVGGFGAVCGDFLIFRFVRSRLVEHILKTALNPRVVRFGESLSSGPLWWLGPLGGIIVIASPLPDEIGLVMMGLSRIGLWQFAVLSFVANSGGIFLMALAAQHFTGA